MRAESTFILSHDAGGAHLHTGPPRVVGEDRRPRLNTCRLPHEINFGTLSVEIDGDFCSAGKVQSRVVKKKTTTSWDWEGDEGVHVVVICQINDNR